jgi:hypothetical protein
VGVRVSGCDFRMWRPLTDGFLPVDDRADEIWDPVDGLEEFPPVLGGDPEAGRARILVNGEVHQLSNPRHRLRPARGVGTVRSPAAPSVGDRCCTSGRAFPARRGLLLTRPRAGFFAPSGVISHQCRIDPAARKPGPKLDMVLAPMRIHRANRFHSTVRGPPGVGVELTQIKLASDMKARHSHMLVGERKQPSRGRHAARVPGQHRRTVDGQARRRRHRPIPARRKPDVAVTAHKRTIRTPAMGGSPWPGRHEPAGELPPWNRPNKRAAVTPISRTPTPTAMT